MSDREVKTRQTVEEWISGRIGDGAIPDEWDREVWNAALASVILPEGRFEVGDEVELDVCVDIKNEVWVRGRIQAVSMDARNYTYQPQYVRPLPKTVELTVEEKIDALGSRGLSWRDIAVLTNSGKTLDQLFADCGIPTTKEVTP